jgi:N-formylglutamate amidohydrolase
MVNTPFGGAIAPMEFYRRDARVYSIMFEANRKLYMNEREAAKAAGFDDTRKACRELMLCAAEYIRASR